MVENRKTVAFALSLESTTSSRFQSMQIAAIEWAQFWAQSVSRT